MPELCRFYGIVIQIYYDDHPPPHFHAKYGDYKAVLLKSNATMCHTPYGNLQSCNKCWI